MHFDSRFPAFLIQMFLRFSLLIFLSSSLQSETKPHFLIIIPDFECSGLVDPAIIRSEPSWVWNGKYPASLNESFARLRLPNLLLPRDPEIHTRITPWQFLVSTVTQKQTLFPEFKPYQKGRDLFVFQYDWRKGIGTDLSLQLQMAIDDFSEQHAMALGKRNDRSSMIIVAHGMGGLLIRTLLGQNPRLGERIQKLYLVGTPHLGTPEALRRLLTGVGFYLPETALTSLETRKLSRLASLSYPSLYMMLPFEDLHWVKNNPKSPSRRVAATDLLKTGEWEEILPSADDEKNLYIDPWKKLLMNNYQEPIDPQNWDFYQENNLIQLQNILAQVRDWRISLGTLGYTQQLLSRPGEDTRVLCVAGTRIKTPLGYNSKGEGLQTVATPLYAPDVDGDGIVPLTSALEKTPLESALLLPGTHHEKLLQDPLFIKEIIQH